MPDTHKVLLIEDEKFISNLLKSRLEKEGFEVKQAFDGEEAITTIETYKPDLMVLDLIMPKKSGFEVLEVISKDPAVSRTPVVVLTNLGQESDMQKVKALGAVDYHVKVRTSIDEIVESVKKLARA